MGGGGSDAFPSLSPVFKLRSPLPASIVTPPTQRSPRPNISEDILMILREQVLRWGGGRLQEQRPLWCRSLAKAPLNPGSSLARRGPAVFVSDPQERAAETELVARAWPRARAGTPSQDAPGGRGWNHPGSPPRAFCAMLPV